MNILITEDNYFEKLRLIKFVQTYNPDFNIECFDNYNDSLEYAKNNIVDLAMLDIKINSDDGYELARELKEINNETEICFVSGYSENAINAFKLDAIGFIEKPYDYDEVSKLLDRFMAIPQKKALPVFVKTFGKFEIYKNNEIVTFNSAKAKELLAFLVNRLGETVGLDDIVMNVFDKGTENGYNYMRIIFHRLNKILKEHDLEYLVGHQKNNYYVNLKEFDCDLYEYNNGNKDYITAYNGAYMEGYDWGKATKNKLDSQLEKKMIKN